MHDANGRFVPLASYDMPKGERSARLFTVEDVKRRRLPGDSGTVRLRFLENRVCEPASLFLRVLSRLLVVKTEKTAHFLTIPGQIQH